MKWHNWVLMLIGALLVMSGSLMLMPPDQYGLWHRVAVLSAMLCGYAWGRVAALSK